jgi:hypothetical protein
MDRKHGRTWEDNVKKLDGRVQTLFVWLRIGPVRGLSELGNEPSGSVKFFEFLD